MTNNNSDNISNNAERQRRFRNKCKTTLNHKQINFWAQYSDVEKFNNLCNKLNYSKKELFSVMIELIEVLFNNKISKVYAENEYDDYSLDFLLHNISMFNELPLTVTLDLFRNRFQTKKILKRSKITKINFKKKNSNNTHGDTISD